MIYEFTRLMQSTNACKQYRGEYRFGLVMFTMVPVTFHSNLYKGKLNLGW